MFLHFYTVLESIEKLKKGEKIQVWNKTESVNTDVHISFDTDKYKIEKISHTVFSVEKVRKSRMM